MAEAIARARFPRWKPFSAGVRPTGYVHPLAICVLHKLGIEHEGASKPAELFRGQDVDVVVTACDDANWECPTWLGKGNRKDESSRDPALARGTEAERLAFFRVMRDETAAALPGLLG